MMMKWLEQLLFSGSSLKKKRLQAFANLYQEMDDYPELRSYLQEIHGLKGVGYNNFCHRQKESLTDALKVINLNDSSLDWLDYGCGNLEITHEVLEIFPKNKPINVWAYDPVPREFKAPLSTDTFHRPSTIQELKDGSVNLLTCIDSSYHWMQVLPPKKLLKKLAPGAFIIILRDFRSEIDPPHLPKGVTLEQEVDLTNSAHLLWQRYDSTWGKFPESRTKQAKRLEMSKRDANTTRKLLVFKYFP